MVCMLTIQIHQSRNIKKSAVEHIVGTKAIQEWNDSEGLGYTNLEFGHVSPTQVTDKMIQELVAHGVSDVICRYREEK